MENKRVYTHYYRDGNIEYRWRTIIQIGNSWEKCGTIFMKNPGSSTHCEKTPSPIVNKELLDNFTIQFLLFVSSSVKFSPGIRLESLHGSDISGVLGSKRCINIYSSTM